VQFFLERKHSAGYRSGKQIGFCRFFAVRGAFVILALFSFFADARTPRSVIGNQSAIKVDHFSGDTSVDSWSMREMGVAPLRCISAAALLLPHRANDEPHNSP